ncbi:MAG: glycoside hydrolase family 3 C-terminal domain-containing protein [Lactobacillales bacterium]|jgi:beta-glucosidase|nr:glycoside hydrolase family 3 C-terminal domain-containing protein [Lactobacillales bacterium]
MDYKQKAAELVGQMTLEEKTSMLSGKTTWDTESIDRLGIASLMMTDGPHGLRKQNGAADNLGVNDSLPATAFPPAVTSASSFDRSLVRLLAETLGEEAQAEKVSVVLGPGINIKRSPLGGRNFEYFSEDPFVAGELGSVYTAGMQSKGIGVSLKHFAANSQEKYRFVSDSIIDERALREIYLSAFEKVVKEANPWTVMSSYNKLNGEYTTESHRLLTEILRDEWGFDGVVISDWTAVNDRVEGVRAGLDLEMPNSGNFLDKIVARAVRNGELEEVALDACVQRLVELALKSAANIVEKTFDVEEHNAISRKIATESAVLLKNEDNILPLKNGAKIAVIGEFAKKPRYQGAGSSRTNPLMLDNPFDALVSLGLDVTYADGNDLNEVKMLAETSDIVIAFAGLTDDYESEGFDRETLAMPENHNAMIVAASAANKNTVVVLQTGSPVVMPWSADVKGILLAYLGGQAGGSAIADLLVGNVTPSGKLAETWPLRLEDTAAYKYFGTENRNVEYRESIFVGYRYYDTVGLDVAYEFGHGLSYTNFEYSNFKADKNGASVTVTNAGTVAGAEIAQIYVIAPSDSKVSRAAQELKGFDKVYLEPGESKEIRFVFDDRTFAFYNVENAAWEVEAGTYEIKVGASSRDIKGSVELAVTGVDLPALASTDYDDLKAQIGADGILNISDAAYESVLGRPIPAELPKKPYTQNTTLGDIQHTLIGKLVYKVAKDKTEATLAANEKEGEEDDGWRKMMETSMNENPLRALSMMSEGMVPPAKLQGMIDLLNGKVVRGIVNLTKTI